MYDIVGSNYGNGKKEEMFKKMLLSVIAHLIAELEGLLSLSKNVHAPRKGSKQPIGGGKNRNFLHHKGKEVMNADGREVPQLVKGIHGRVGAHCSTVLSGISSFLLLIMNTIFQ